MLTRLLRKSTPSTPQLRNEASLNCVSLRSELDCELRCEAVKGQDERRHSAAPLTASQRSRGLCSTTETSKAPEDRQKKGGRHVGLDFL